MIIGLKNTCTFLSQSLKTFFFVAKTFFSKSWALKFGVQLICECGLFKIYIPALSVMYMFILELRNLTLPWAIVLCLLFFLNFCLYKSTETTFEFAHAHTKRDKFGTIREEVQTLDLQFCAIYYSWILPNSPWFVQAWMNTKEVLYVLKVMCPHFSVKKVVKLKICPNFLLNLFLEARSCCNWLTALTTQQLQQHKYFSYHHLYLSLQFSHPFLSFLLLCCSSCHHHVASISLKKVAAVVHLKSQSEFLYDNYIGRKL